MIQSPRTSGLKIALSVALTSLAAIAAAQPNPYRTLSDWVQHGAQPLGSVSAVWPDADGNLWIAERCSANDCVGDGPAHFNGPTAVLVAPNCDVFVADGHEPDSNNRIVKFSSDGTFLKAWGGSGSRPGEFLVPHSLAMDARGRLFVADRDNNRIQIFDQEG